MLTANRLAISHYLHDHDTPPIDQLAQDIKRDPDAIRVNLRRLAKLDIIAFTGKTDHPTLKHKHVIIEPRY